MAPAPVAGAPRGAADPFYRIRPEGRLFRHLECLACGLIGADPLPTAEELRAVYAERYNFEWFQRRRFLKGLQARHRWHRVRSGYLGPAAPGAGGRVPRLLDVGAGQGDFVRCARHAGWDALGLDPAAPLAGGDPGLRRGGAEDLVHLQDSYDLITFWHCLEHLADPRGVLRQAGALLAPGGRLLLAVPNRRATGLARAGRNWGWLQEPFVHLWQFTPEALERLLPEGLATVKVETREAWDQQTWFSSRAYGLLTNRLPSGSVFRREVIHLLGFAGLELAAQVGRPGQAARMDRPELVIVAARTGA